MSETQNNEKYWSKIASLDEALAHGLTEQEFRSIVEMLGREINLVELGICAALYSEHCSYKSTRVHLKNFPTKSKHVLQGPGENAGVIDIGEGLAVTFKVESHNHPTFIEPYQGAATGVGGILRDVFTMGARPLALMNALRFGCPDEPKGKYLLSHAVAGIGGYGNCIGIPTVGGELFFHDAYKGNCLVNAFALGLVEHDSIFLGSAAGIGNRVLYVGSKTGRDGIHGATMASESFAEDSQEKRPTVQVGDPFQEKLLLEACLEVMRGDGVVGIQDMGAAGLTSSSYEMAHRAGTGLKLNLDKVPQRESKMNPYEIMLSESQERMLLVVEPSKKAEVLKIFSHWELDAVEIGEVIKDQVVELYWHGELISSMPVSVVTEAVPQYHWPEKEPSDYAQRLAFQIDEELINGNLPTQEISRVWLDFLAAPNLCSRRPVFKQYDSTVRSNTVVHPGGDAALIRVKREGGDHGKPEKGIAMTLDCNSRYCAIDPRQGSALSLAEAYRNISAVGAVPLGISDCLNFGSPEKPEGMWEIAESIRGLSEAARAFEIPVVSGNVSLYNETLGKAILPTPMIALVGLVEDAAKSPTIYFKQNGSRVLVLGETKPQELGGSEYLAFAKGIEKGALPILDYDLEIKSANLIRELIAKQLLLSVHDISSGGLAIALAECCFNEQGILGVNLQVENFQGGNQGLLFSESGARYIISCKPEHEAAVRKAVQDKQLKVCLSGSVGGDSISITDMAALNLEKAFQAWGQGLLKYFN